jgi:hypothetical protein
MSTATRQKSEPLPFVENAMQLHYEGATVLFDIAGNE